MKLNYKLKTYLLPETLKDNNITLFVDSFDEGLDIENNKENLIKNYVNLLGNPKILVSCRTGYLTGYDFDSWFYSDEG